MFTGIIEEVGTVSRIEKKGGIFSITVNSVEVAKGLGAGDSVAVNGVCLTAVSAGAGKMVFGIMGETARRSTLKDLREKDSVNLEGSVKADGVFGGHFVQGHIDCVGTVRGINRTGDDLSMDIEVPGDFHDLYVDKGSVALDGVSLTVGKAGSGRFRVYLIPHTLKCSTLGQRKINDRVNVEFDVIGKYMARAEKRSRKAEVTEKFLEDKGFI